MLIAWFGFTEVCTNISIGNPIPVNPMKCNPMESSRELEVLVLFFSSFPFLFSHRTMSRTVRDTNFRRKIRNYCSKFKMLQLYFMACFNISSIKTTLLHRRPYLNKLHTRHTGTVCALVLYLWIYNQFHHFELWMLSLKLRKCRSFIRQQKKKECLWQSDKVLNHSHSNTQLQTSWRHRARTALQYLRNNSNSDSDRACTIYYCNEQNM